MIPQVEGLLAEYDFKEGDPILAFCRMAGDVAGDASYFMEQYKTAAWNKYLKVSSRVAVTTPAPVAAPVSTPVATPPASVSVPAPVAAPPKKTRKPRKSRGADTIFMAENRKSVKANPEHKDKDGKQIGAVLKEMWGKLDEEGKKPYVEKAMKEKEEYDQKMKDYTPPPKTKKAKKAKKVKDPNAPKKFQSAYQFFGAKLRADVAKENEGKSKEDQKKIGMKEIAAEWKQVSAEDKKPYEEQSAKAKVEWEKQVAIYKKTKAEQVEQAEQVTA